MTSNVPKQWLKWLLMVEYWYNTNYHSSLKTTHFHALYGYSPSYLSMRPYTNILNEDAKDVVQQRKMMSPNKRENLLSDQNRIKIYADKDIINR